MNNENKMKKPVSTIALTINKSQDIKAIENLREMVKVLPGCSDATSALRWLCEVEVPKITNRFMEVLNAS
ncbi:MAG: hypothetical protein JW837_18090 [Sedimentisphaerales bacterium]|nr:hypothetical protein [Sedimentisphaerales bacterium]